MWLWDCSEGGGKSFEWEVGREWTHQCGVRQFCANVLVHVVGEVVRGLEIALGIIGKRGADKLYIPPICESGKECLFIVI